MTMFWPSTQPSCLIDSHSGFVETDFASSSGLGVGPTPRTPTRATFPALYSWAAAAPSGAHARTKPVSKRRRDITVHPESRRTYCPAARIRGSDTRERRPKHDGLELADERTFPRRAPGGSAADCPRRQENGARGSRESGPSEGRYKANL